MYIKGEWIKSEKTFAVFNPANGKQIGDVVDGNADDASMAIEAAADAFMSW